MAPSFKFISLIESVKLLSLLDTKNLDASVCEYNGDDKFIVFNGKITDDDNCNGCSGGDRNDSFDGDDFIIFGDKLKKTELKFCFCSCLLNGTSIKIELFFMRLFKFVVKVADDELEVAKSSKLN